MKTGNVYLCLCFMIFCSVVLWIFIKIHASETVSISSGRLVTDQFCEDLSAVLVVFRFLSSRSISRTKAEEYKLLVRNKLCHFGAQIYWTHSGFFYKQTQGKSTHTGDCMWCVSSFSVVLDVPLLVSPVWGLLEVRILWTGDAVLCSNIKG